MVDSGWMGALADRRSKRLGKRPTAACAVILFCLGAVAEAHGQTRDSSGTSPTVNLLPVSGAAVVAHGASSTHQSPLNEIFSDSRETLLGDAGGVRPTLDAMGLSFGLQDTNEIMGNVTGGVRRGAAYDGLTMASVGLDTDKAFGWPGGTINVSVLDIRGRSLSADNLMNLQTVSNISAAPAVRLWEMFFQQAFANGRFDVKIGQQSIDQEFITSQGSGVFLNTMMGWPMVPSADLYAGGPSYPLSSLGVRLRGRLTDSVTVLSGVFDDNPPGGSLLNDSQLRGAERTGTLFNLGTGALIIGEVQYALNQPLGQSGGASSALSGLYKLGFWYDTGRFVSQRYDTAGLSLADPRSTGTSATRWHNFSIYAVADQTVWQSDPQALGVFVRAMGAPGDRNLISFSANAGVTLKAPVPGRDNDVLGIGFGMTRISGAASGLDEDMNTFGQGPVPVRSSESFLELTYQAQVAPWWLFQPDFQYVFRPGAGLQDPNRPAQRIKDEAVLGVRSVVTF